MTCTTLWSTYPTADLWDDDPGAYTYSKSDFIREPWENIKDHIEHNLLRFATTPGDILAFHKEDDCDELPKDRLMRVCRQYFDRDAARASNAARLENLCRPKHAYTTLVEILLRDCVVDSNCEIATLLHYIKELLEFKFCAYYLVPTGDTALYGPDGPNRWHITPQTKPGQVNVECWKCRVDLE